MKYLQKIALRCSDMLSAIFLTFLIAPIQKHKQPTVTPEDWEAAPSEFATLMSIPNGPADSTPLDHAGILPAPALQYNHKQQQSRL